MTDSRAWRDLADKLTPEQIANLEKTERHCEQLWPDDQTAGMLGLARRLVAENERKAAGTDSAPLTPEAAQELWDRLAIGLGQPPKGSNN